MAFSIKVAEELSIVAGKVIESGAAQRLSAEALKFLATAERSASRTSQVLGLGAAELEGLGSRAAQAAGNPIMPEILAAGGASSRGSGGQLAKRAGELRRILGDPNCSSSLQACSSQELRLLTHGGAELQSLETRVTDPATLSRKYLAATEDNAVLSSVNRKRQQAGASYADLIEERLPGDEDHMSELSDFLKHRYGNRTDLNVLETGGANTTAVPLALETQLARYTACEPILPYVKGQRQTLLNGNFPPSKYTGIVGDNCRLPVTSGSQDLVVASFNSNFSGASPSNVELALNEAARVLKSDGELVLQPVMFKESRAQTNSLMLSRFRILDWRPLPEEAVGKGLYLMAMGKRI